MMRLNLDNVNTLLSLDMLSPSPTSVNSAEYELFEAHLRHAERGVDKPSPAHSERSSTSQRSKKDRSSEAHDSSPGYSEETTSPADRSNDEIGRSAESRSDEDAELDDVYAEAEHRRAEKDAAADEDAEDEETADEVAVAVTIAEDVVSTTPSMRGGEGKEVTAELEADMTDPVTGTQSGTPVLPGGEDQAGNSGDTAENSLASAEQALEGVVSVGQGTATEAEQAGATLAASEGNLSSNVTGEALSGSGPDGQGSSGEAGTAEQTALEALTKAAQLREDARRQIDRQKRVQPSQDVPNQTVQNVDDQMALTNASAGSQTAVTEAVLAIPVQSETANPATATTSRDTGEQVSAVQTTTSEPSQRSASTTTSERIPGGEQAERVRFVQRVARAFESMGDRNGTIRLALHPAELGSLKLHLSVRNGTMEARVEVETESARNLLVENLPALRERLADQNIKVERFDVELTDRSTGSSSQDTGQRSPSQEQARRGDRPFPSADGRKQNTSAETPRAARRGSPERLDILI